MITLSISPDGDITISQETPGERIYMGEHYARMDREQEEFVSQDALQCGFCTPGFLMSTRALLDHNPNPTDEEIVEVLSGNLCRCTGYIPILQAVKRTAERERKELGR